MTHIHDAAMAVRWIDLLVSAAVDGNSHKGSSDKQGFKRSNRGTVPDPELTEGAMILVVTHDRCGQ